MKTPTQCDHEKYPYRISYGEIYMDANGMFRHAVLVKCTKCKHTYRSYSELVSQHQLAQNSMPYHPLAP